MSEDNNTNNNSDINEQSSEISEPEQLHVQMALPVTPTATYSSVPPTQTQGYSGEQTIRYIPPIYTINGETNTNVSQDMVTQEMVIVYQFGKSVKCLSIFDIFFGFLHFLVSPYGLISFIFPFFGYKGATSYKKYLVDTYLGYQIVYCFINVLILINILFNKNIELPEKQTVETASFLQTITILLNIYFARIIRHFSYNLKKITPQQRTLLLMMSFENTRGIYL